MDITRLDVGVPARHSPIAIIGIGCRFPGADSAAEYWQLLRDGVDATGPIPGTRTDYLQKGVLGRIVRRGGFVIGVEDFDPYFFGLSPREAIGLDPQTRLLFEAAWRSVEDAGITAQQLKEVRTGVFVGLCSEDYTRLILAHSPGMEFQATFGASRSSGSGRISHALGLRGPSATIDTACSSSLVSVHLAVRAIQDGDCDLALAGGANVLLTPENTATFMRGGLLSLTGRCEAFREGANGFVRSEGAGMVLLKPLARAVADEDRVYAVIRGSAVNNDGGESLYMAPSVTGQVNVARAALADSGVSPHDVQYVEAHGTGTRIGDPTEAEALSTAFCEGRPTDRPLRIGSCKANIGHLEAGAGVAGLIKAALGIWHGELPPSLHAHPLNADIPWTKWHLQVQQQLEQWPDTGRPRVAGVNSFGITGTNAHIVLTELPGAEPARALHARSLHVLPISARDEVSLKVVAAEWQRVLESPAARLDDLCHTASTRRTHFDYRLAVLGRSPHEMAERLAAWAEGHPADGVVSGRVMATTCNGPVFVYSGIGSQWPGMALDLYEQYAVFRDTFDHISELFEHLSGIRLIDEIRRPPESSRIDRVRVMQPALFTLQIALTELWKSWGVEPSAVLGHSLGEVAAACVAGALSLEDAALYVHVRSDCLTRIEGVGGMLALGVTPERARDIIRGLEGQLAIGVITTTDSVVLSGDRVALRAIEEQFKNSDVFCRPVNASVATHSPLMDPFLAEIGERIASMRPRSERIPFYSTVTGTRLEGLALTVDYWVRNIRDCVLFGPAMQNILDDGARLFIELSAHPLLVQPMQKVATHDSIAAVILSTLKRNSGSAAAMLDAFCHLYATGYPVDWNAHRHPGARHTDVPGHPFRRERLWVKDVGPTAPAEQTYSRTARPQAHALLPIRCDAADRPGTVTWQVTLDPLDHPFLAQHVVGGQALLPLTTYIELSVAAATEMLGPGSKTLRNMRLLKGRFFGAGETIALQIVFTATGSDSSFISFYARGSSGDWTLTCDVTVSERGPSADFDPHVTLQDAAVRFPVQVTLERLHQTQVDHGFRYGPLYQGIREAWRGTRECLTRIEYLPDIRQEAGFHLHPAFLDAFLQRPFVGFLHEEGERPIPMLPVSIEEIHVAEIPVGDAFWGYGTTESGPGWERYDDWLLADDGRPLMMVRGLLATEFEAPGGQARELSTADWMYDTAWERADSSPIAASSGLWLIVTDDQQIAARVSSRLEAMGNVCPVISPGDAEMAVANILDVAAMPWRGIIYALPFPAVQADGSGGPEFQRSVCGGLLDLLHACTRADRLEVPRLFVVSRGAFRVVNVDKPILPLAPTTGLARVANHEFPALRVTIVDLDATDASCDSLISELHSEWTGESDVAFRGGQRFVSRLVRKDVLALPRRTTRLAIDDASPATYRVGSPTPGVIESISLELAERRAPGPGEVEIRVAAGGLNFLDVLRSLRMGPAQAAGPVTFGMECSGVIARVGEGVNAFQPGQRVVAMAMSEGCFQAYLTIGEHFVFALPASVDLRDAATWIVAYQTAWYALNEVGRLRAGEKILIHAAAGGVGLAAVHVARHLGCEVFATAGSPEKRAYLHQLGVRHVMNSRTLEFADEVMKLTDGRGVDAVLNSISGEAIPRSLAVLAMGGRFLEIGKRDIYANSKLELLPFRRNLSYFAIDMLGLTLECEERVLRVTREVLDLLIGGALPALPWTAFGVTRAQDAFRHMAQSRQIGKVLIAFDASTLDVEITAERLVRADASYLITGGLSGIGLLCAQWLVGRGARHLVLAGRRAPGADALEIIATLRQSGVTIVVASTDVSDARQVRALIDQCCSDESLPLAGVIHAAGVIRDGVIQNLTWERFEAVFAPKVYGTAHLAAALEGRSLDFFVLFSSIASTLASPGQGNYAAANAYLDAFGDALGSDHQSVLRINWGPWTGLGMLDAGGIRPAPMFGEHGIRSQEGIAALDVLLARQCSRSIVMPVDWTIWRDVAPETISKPFYAHMRREIGAGTSLSGANERASTIASLPESEAIAFLAGVLREAVMRVLKIPDDRMENTVSLLQFGLDSLMAVELGNRIQMDLGITFSLMKLLRGPTVEELASILYPDVVAAGRAPGAAPASELSDADISGLAAIDESDAILAGDVEGALPGAVQST